jgi:hypothetical protein
MKKNFNVIAVGAISKIKNPGPEYQALVIPRGIGFIKSSLTY